MNCQQFRQQVVKALAAKEAVNTEMAAHQRACPECQAFRDVQSRTFFSVDQTLAAIANSPVPPSLLPMIRARLDEQTSLRRFRISGWPLAAVAVSALFVIALAFYWRRPLVSPTAPEVARKVISERHEVKAALRPATKPAPGPANSVMVPPPRSVTLEEPTPQVIVLAEERAAFEHFAARVPQDPAAAAALTRPAPKGNETPVEIALLQIGNLELKPLEPQAAE